MQNIHSILTVIGHRVGHQSGLDESSGRNSTIFLLELRSASIRCFLRRVLKNNTTQQILTKDVIFEKGMSLNKKTPAARMNCRKWDLRIPIHIQVIFISTNIFL